MSIATKLFFLLFMFAFICAAQDRWPIKFNFQNEYSDSGFIKNEGTLNFLAIIKSSAKGESSNCFVKTPKCSGFEIGTPQSNCIVTRHDAEINKVFAKGFSVKFGFTLPESIKGLRPKNHLLVLASKYDNGINDRTFSVFAKTNGSLFFEVSKNGISVVGCGKSKALTPGKPAVVEAMFIPGKEIVLCVDGVKVARKKLVYKSLHQSNVPLCIGARLYNGTPINYGEGVVAFFEATPISGSEDARDFSDPENKKENSSLTLTRDSKNAFAQDNGMRGEICLNGIWLWQPQIDENKDAPDEKDWLYRKVPAFRHPCYEIKNKNGKAALKYKGQKLKGKEKAWLGTEFNIPKSWQDRDIYFEVQGLAGEEPIVILDGQKMLLSPDIPYKFPLKYTDKPVKVRIKADTVKQHVWLRSYPQKNSLRFVGVAPSWRKKELGINIEGTCQPKEKLFARVIVSENVDMKKVEKKSAWHEVATKGDIFEFKFAMPWKSPKEWTPDTPNLYYVAVELKNDRKKLIDRTQSIRFGFREIWVEDGALKLNGKNVNLRGNVHTPFGSKSSYSAYMNKENAKWVLKKWKEDTNLNSFLIWAQAKEHMPDKSAVLEAADELGMLVLYQLPPGQRDFSDFDVVNNYNKRLLTGEVKRYVNHPSVFAWNLGTSHYTWICAPAMLGKKIEPERYWEKIKKQTDYFLPKKEMIKKIDPSRVFTTHSGGHNKVSDLLTGMVYINPDAGLQERANWPLAWWKNRKNLKPLFVTEISCIFYGVFYQRKATNSIPLPNTEPIFLEHGAELFGDRIYQDEPEKYVEKYFGSKQATNLVWSKDPSPVVWNFKREYLKYAYRAWRTYGVGFFFLVEIRPGFDNRRLPKLDKNANIQTPGFFPDRNENANDAPGDLNSWGKSLQEHMAPFYAYIGGDGVFTTKDHAYYSGEQIVKRAIVLNDYFYSIPVEVEWTLADKNGKTVFQKKYKKEIAAGGRAIDDFRLQFTAPNVSKKTEYTLSLTAKSNDMERKDQFKIQVYPHSTNSYNKNITLFVFDPVGETRVMLDAAGFNVKDASNKIPKKGILVIGRHVLENDKNVKKLAQLGFDKKLECGLKVIVFEQACKNILGLKAYENSPRRVFISAKGHPVLKGISSEDVWHWRGESDLIEPYPVPQNIPSSAGGWFPERFWKWGNDNNVATYVIQKPMKGAFRAVLDSGLDLMDTPLLESCKGKGRVIFCQLDVAQRYNIDHVASKIVDNIFDYMNKVAEPNSKLVKVKYEKGDSVFEGFRLKKPEGKLGWGMNNGDFYFRKKVKLPAYKKDGKLSLVKLDKGRAAISFSESDLQSNWQKYKYFKIIAALKMNQGGSDNIGVSTELHGNSDEFYPVNWHFGFIHPYTGWCW
jgi:glycosyl hydrolase family 2